MPLKKGLGWNSDEVSALVGFDGTEPPETLRWYSKYHETFPCRIACAINQYYPELPSGYYLNKALLALVQEALEETGLHVVIEDNYRQGGLVPEELPGSLDENDDYLLVNQDMTLCGRMYVWES